MEASARRSWRAIGSVVPDTLPRYLTSFVGRGTELSKLKYLLGRTRMVTITGPGGAGKTRLAVELGRACLDRWPRAVWWVDLAPVSDPRQMDGAVVSALELPGQGPAREVVIAWLGARRALLMLDNCEHLVAACSDFCQTALERCPELTIIATSREALGVSGEAHWLVSALKPPDAVHLFEARARLVLPDFKVAASNLNSVTKICERLDGLPLAIELAAARVGMMAEREILSQLSDRFRLLTGGDRTAPERQQTMIATIDWSYRLLTADEALLFRRLAVFRGGFTLESIDAICGEGLDGSVLDLLAGLVQKSMVVAERTDRSASRYRLLESQLAYSAERLRGTGELELLRRRHYEFFRDSVSTKTYIQTGHRASQPPPGVAEAEWIAREAGNLTAAMEWARDNADDLGLGLTLDLAGNIWSGGHAQARSALIDLVDRSPDKAALKCRALRGVSMIAYAQGEYEAALRWAEKSVALARELRNDEDLALTLAWEGNAHAVLDEFDIAIELNREATSLLKGSSNRRLLTNIRAYGASLAFRMGDYIASRDVLVECVATAKAEGNMLLTASCLDDLACAQWGLKDHPAAVVSFKEALIHYRSMRDNDGIVFDIQCLSCVACEVGDYQRSVRLGAAASRNNSEWVLGVEPWLSKRTADSQAQSRSKLGLRKTEESWKVGWTMSVDQAIDYALGESEPKIAVDAGPLSRRELEVAKLVAAGLTNRQIAQRLFIAERSAEGHVERIRSKLGFRSRTEVATWAVERGLTHSAASEFGNSNQRKS